VENERIGDEGEEVAGRDEGARAAADEQEGNRTVVDEVTVKMAGEDELEEERAEEHEEEEEELDGEEEGVGAGKRTVPRSESRRMCNTMGVRGARGAGAEVEGVGEQEEGDQMKVEQNGEGESDRGKTSGSEMKREGTDGRHGGAR
jgi:hypothetical protein